MTGYITVKRAAEEQGVSRRRISHLLVQGRIQGAVKFGHQWAIPCLWWCCRPQRWTSRLTSSSSPLTRCASALNSQNPRHPEHKTTHLLN